MTAGYMVVEVIGGLLSGSLALIADAGHMLTDAAALALAWAAFRFGRRIADSKRTFGYMRLEVLAAFINAVTLIGLVAWIAYEAIQRFLAPEPVLALPMLVVAALGLLVNGVVFLILRRADNHHVNVRGAMLHVLGDMLGSVAAIVAAVVIYLTGWMPIDPILSVLLSVILLRSGWFLLKSSLHILMEGAPENVSTREISNHLLANVRGIKAVDHIHLWSITSQKTLVTLEIALVEGTDAIKAVATTKRELADRFGLVHSTVEVSRGQAQGCALAPAT